METLVRSTKDSFPSLKTKYKVNEISKQAKHMVLKVLQDSESTLKADCLT